MEPKDLSTNSKPPVTKIRDDTLCNFDQITVLTKLLAELKSIGCTIGPNYLKIDQNSKKEMKDKIDIFY